MELLLLCEVACILQIEGGLGRERGVGGSKHLLPANAVGDERDEDVGSGVFEVEMRR